MDDSGGGLNNNGSIFSILGFGDAYLLEYNGLPADTKLTPDDRIMLQNFHSLAPKGPMTEDQFLAYGKGSTGIAKSTLDQLNPQTKAAVLNDPVTFFKGQLGATDLPDSYYKTVPSMYPYEVGGPAQAPTRQNISGVAPVRYNSANHSFLSVGAEGGSANLGNLQWMPGVGLVQDPNNYMTVHGDDGMFGVASTLFTLVATAVGGPIAGGAAAGFTSASESGGNPLTGALKGAAAGYVGGQIASGLSDYNPTVADSIWSDTATPGLGENLQAVGLGGGASVGADISNAADTSLGFEPTTTNLPISGGVFTGSPTTGVEQLATDTAQTTAQVAPQLNAASKTMWDNFVTSVKSNITDPKLVGNVVQTVGKQVLLDLATGKPVDLGNIIKGTALSLVGNATAGAISNSIQGSNPLEIADKFTSKVVADTIGASAASGLIAGATGGNVGQAILSGAAGTIANDVVSNATSGMGTDISNAAGKISGGAVQAAVTGHDPVTAIVMGTLDAAGNYAYKQIFDGPQQVPSGPAATMTSGNPAVVSDNINMDSTNLPELNPGSTMTGPVVAGDEHIMLNNPNGTDSPTQTLTNENSTTATVGAVQINRPAVPVIQVDGTPGAEGNTANSSSLNDAIGGTPGIIGSTINIDGTGGNGNTANANTLPTLNPGSTMTGPEIINNYGNTGNTATLGGTPGITGAPVDITGSTTSIAGEGNTTNSNSFNDAVGGTGGVIGNTISMNDQGLNGGTSTTGSGSTVSSSGGPSLGSGVVTQTQTPTTSTTQTSTTPTLWGGMPIITQTLSGTSTAPIEDRFGALAGAAQLRADAAAAGQKAAGIINSTR